ncbi:hypothetical protein [Thioalkalivibrio sp. XN279]|uniref:hypothetical protein n=1 Tax=Thioalkalivibrio sp. XN279 TaxID=2714953 RepID=UPI00140957E2|nr:hypothetical protein [Thioalkalivibrio sp. XN279]NHA13427.1 hypothetical protein [Thioalkalivibrio sp. XN279]
MEQRGSKPAGQGLRDALRWLSAEGRHDAAAVEEACRRFDLSPLDEEFLLAEARRLRSSTAGDRGGQPEGQP